MKTQILFFFTILLILLPGAICANIYEGFDMADLNSTPLASSEATRLGHTSRGRNSTWQATVGKHLVLARDLEIKGFESCNSMAESIKP